jgi:hypothetical protein
MVRESTLHAHAERDRPAIEKSKRKFRGILSIIIFHFPIDGISMVLDAIAAPKFELPALARQRPGDVTLNIPDREALFAAIGFPRGSRGESRPAQTDG